MSTTKRPVKVLKDVKINVKIKLAALWITLMFFYLYADVLAFYKPGHLESVITGEMAGIQFNQMFLLGSAMVMAIPSIMVFLSLALRAKANRLVNIIIGIVYAGMLILTSVISEGKGTTWLHGSFYILVEALCIILIIWHAWKWPRFED